MSYLLLLHSPSFFIPFLKHFFSLQCWHWFLGSLFYTAAGVEGKEQKKDQEKG